MDSQTTVESLKKLAQEFRDERDWKQFHNPKDLALALCIEAGELGELFLWKNGEQVEQMLSTEEGRKKAEGEVADVMLYCLSFSNALSLDLSAAVREKLKENGLKYPIEKSRGNARKYDEL